MDVALVRANPPQTMPVNGSQKTTTGVTTGNPVYKNSVYTVFQLISAAAATVVIEVSADQGTFQGTNSNWITLGTITLAAAGTDGFATSTAWPYVRARVTAATAATSVVMGCQAMTTSLNPTGQGLPGGIPGSTPSGQSNDVPWIRENLEPTIGGAVQDLVLSAAGLGTVNTADLYNIPCKGVVVVINITAITGTTPTLTVTVQGKAPAGNVYYTILASAALAATGQTVLRVYPGLTAAANLTASDVIPRTWRISYTIGGTTPAVTATIDAMLIV